MQFRFEIWGASYNWTFNVQLPRFVECSSNTRWIFVGGSFAKCSQDFRKIFAGFRQDFLWILILITFCATCYSCFVPNNVATQCKGSSGGQKSIQKRVHWGAGGRITCGTLLWITQYRNLEAIKGKIFCTFFYEPVPWECIQESYPGALSKSTNFRPTHTPVFFYLNAPWHRRTPQLIEANVIGLNTI